MKKSTLNTLFVACALTAGFSAHATEEVTIYSTREPGLLQPLLDSFTQDTGIKTNAIFVQDGLVERVETEGKKSPADVLMVVDIGKLVELADKVAQPIHSDLLEKAIPAQYRDVNDKWFALSLRHRVLYVNKDLDITSFKYEELADPKWKGKVCIRSGQHPYNTSLFSAYMAHHGAAKTEQFLHAVTDNLARKATGGDRDVARDIAGGICELGFANSYYVGKMKTASGKNAEQVNWVNAIKVIYPTFDVKGGGTHANVSGAVVAKYAPHKENAIKLLEYLVSPKAQAEYAKINFERPVLKGAKVDPIIAELGAVTNDSLPMSEIPKYRKEVSKLVDKVGFDN